MVGFHWTQIRVLLSYAVLVVSCSQGIYTGRMQNNCKRKEKIKMTVVSFKPRMSESSSLPLPHYQCFLGAEDGDAEVTSSRPFKTRNKYEAPPHTAIFITDKNRPANTAVYNVSLDVTNNNAFGVFTCDASKEDRQNTTIMTIFLQSDGYIFPSDQQFTKTVNKGDEGVVIDMTITSDTSVPLDNGRKDIRWRVNGSGTVYHDYLNANAYQGEDYEILKSHPITVGDEGVYESHIFRNRNGRHGLQKLIVRSCEAGKWGPPGCNGVCDNCYNGGVCDDETGRCICSPGFMGPNCLTECGANTFGYNCEFKCDYAGTDDCAGRLFCLLDPYGCTCSTGYKSLNCTSTCERGKFGAGCLQECHCDDDRCDRFTGKCESGRCQNGWSGTNCQIPDKCPSGYFDNVCTGKCFCLNGSSCDKETGACSNGECDSGSVQASGSARCQECPNGYYGKSCLEECHCESEACDKATGECIGCCHRQWIETNNHACQRGKCFTTGIHNSSFKKVNPGLATVVACVSNDDRVVLSREIELLDDQGVNHIHTSFLQSKDGIPLFNTSFLVSNVSSTNTFYCQLWSRDSSTLLAWLNTTFSPNELPVLITAPSSPGKSMNSVTIIWRPWEEGIDVGDPPVVGYVVYYREMGAKDWFNGSFNKPMEITVTDLDEDTIYQFSVAVVRSGKDGKGPMGPVTTVKTLCRLPEAPTHVESSLTDDGKVKVSWQIPLNIKCSTGVTSFTIYAHGEGIPEEVIVVGYSGEQMSSNLLIEGLEPGVRYEFQVSLTTDQESAYSNKSGVLLIPMPSARSTIIYIVVSIVIVFLLATTILIVVLRCRRRKKFTPPCDKMIATYNKETVIFQKKGADYENSCHQSSEHSNLVKVPKILEDGNTLHVSNEATHTVGEDNATPMLVREGDHTAFLEEGRQSDILNDKKVDGHKEDQSRKTEDIYGNIPTAISVSTLAEYYSKNKNNIMEEFHLLKKGQQYPWIVSTRPENKKKNRYKNLYTYDHSRVIIGNLSDDKNSDYFNASYILDHHGKQSFIASQAPKANSVNDFWNMIWSEEVTTVVMLTNLIENGKDRCTKYWPNDEGCSQVFGTIVVFWTSTTIFADFIVRKLQVSQGDALREVYQVHFTAWPDMDVPSERTPLMDCIQHTKKIHKHSHSPILTHCSAGVGRTGTFISIYCLMEVIKNEENINVFKFVNEARKSRINFVLKENQYLFIYKCLVDYLLTRHTVKSHADILTTDFNMVFERKNLSDEFELLTHFDHHQNSKFGIGEDRCLKNRFRDIEPNDSGRVFLMSEKRTSFSNYINATLFRSVTKNDAYISTQSPLPNTTGDFWRLIYEWKCPLIIMLNELDIKDETCVQYWPDEGTTEFGNISVSFRDGSKCSSYFMREFQVFHAEHGDTRKVHQLQLLSWPEGDDFSPLQMIRNYVHELLGYINHEEGPVVIHCINGVSRSCIFIALECALEQMQISQTVDVFTIVRQMRHRNSFAIRDEEEYVFIYQALQHILQAV
ncbi:Receptor-type tyrosine-protein phosphatase alpha [Holothuria leucospilota]|uniref:protein-tyrosine-phosphatase n=1 Tax=Holothuria leucospilota TaxID=206669 RepID=A0A9Q1HBJ7_HOLLE|nr:Receptor-type tyrosine-protein phosphatase alpha [Holothuria leucospilota]